VLHERFHPDVIVGASAGSWNAWAIAGGATCEELAALWLDKATSRTMQFRLHRAGFLRTEPMYETARSLFARYQPRVPVALTLVEVPSMRSHIVRDREITWKHLAASGSIPFGYPPMKIDGKFYVDGGLRAGLPLWASEKLGACRALALNVLNTPGFRLLHHLMRGKKASATLEVVRVEPSRRLGSLGEALVWNASNIERWIELGRRDATSVMI
jgi:predicted acylesterase/phospholipase RssA